MDCVTLSRILLIESPFQGGSNFRKGYTHTQHTYIFIVYLIRSVITVSVCVYARPTSDALISISGWLQCFSNCRISFLCDTLGKLCTLTFNDRLLMGWD